ncbi:hypothetical protein DB30_00172 [Enhygromyxa salina]|uniref:Uncharacterized protein n=1 Tax=Enhygromyxa salina TaxID=215803 RepID=A0A0C2A7R5_9BACT|nr:hypothetical protein [Enhygromyxa salina]KIG19663.1 hypothetical protein DB30_00172 [Enhygromyxa salina]
MVLGPTLAVLLALGPTSADAGARIAWEAPLECPTASSLERRVSAYLGRAMTSSPSATSIVVVGRVHASRGGFVLELTTAIDGVRDQQQLSHHDCASLLELAASLAAIAIDPLAITERRLISEPPIRVMEIQRPRPAAPPHAAPAPHELDELATLAELAQPTIAPSTNPAPIINPAPPAVLDPTESVTEFELYASEDTVDHGDEQPQPTRALVSAVGGLALNLFPNPAPQLRGGVGLQHGNHRVAFRALLDAGVTLAGQFRSANGSVGGDLLAWDIAVHPCGVPRWGIVELRACAAFGAGQIRARGVGVAEPLRRTHPWLWLAAEAGLAVELGRTVALVVDFGANFNVLRPNFSTAAPDASYLTPVVSGRAGLGVELRFF